MNALLTALKWSALALLAFVNPASAFAVMDALDDEDDE